MILIDNRSGLELRRNSHPERAPSQTVTTNPRVLWITLLFTNHYQLEIFSISVTSKKLFWILRALTSGSVILCD